MCGRFSLGHIEEVWIKRRFHAGFDFEWEPRYNLAPKQPALTVVAGEGGRKVMPMIWGFTPHWAKESGPGIINARGETVAEKPMFRSSFSKRRCLVLADGFYEWKKAGGKKEPYRIILKGGPVFSFAGIYDTSDGGDHTFAILTTESNPMLSFLHDRMPVILDEKGEEEWLDPNAKDPKRLLVPYPGGKMECYRVNEVVNSWKNDTPECIEPVKSL